MLPARQPDRPSIPRLKDGALPLLPPLVTPLVRSGEIWVKLEVKQWACTVKYRLVHDQIQQAQDDGSLRRAPMLLAASSGGRAVALAFAGKRLGLPVEIHAGSGLDPKIRSRILAFHATVVEHPAGSSIAEIRAEAARRALRLGAWLLPDGTGPRPPAYRILGAELAGQLRQADVEDLRAVLCPARSGAMLRELGTFLKGTFPDLKIIAVDPVDSCGVSRLALEDPSFPDELRPAPKLDLPAFVDGVPLGENGSAALELARTIGGPLLVLSPD